MTTQRVEGVPVSPVRKLGWLEAQLGQTFWAKLETSLPGGSFKFRGAMHTLGAIAPDQLVVTASAGNHALAIAEAAARTGHPVLVCLPHNATEVKRHRLSTYDIAVREVGDSLDEAHDYASEYADRVGGVFVSPYNDKLIIAGQSSLLAEYLDQVPDLTHLLVPVGGGGLLAGSYEALLAANRRLALIGCQSESFHPVIDHLIDGSDQRVPPVANLADGLLLNPVSGAITLDRLPPDMPFVTVDEAGICAGIHALIHHESLLVEGAGAIGLGAVLTERWMPPPGSVTGLILTGGNISITNLAIALTHPHDDPIVRQRLGAQGTPPSIQSVLSGLTPDHLPTMSAWEGSTAQELRSLVALVQSRAEDFNRIATDQALAVSDAEAGSVRRLAAELDALTGVYETELAGIDSGAAGPDVLYRAERLERSVRSLAAFLADYSAWQSPSYDQSVVAAFNSVADLGSPGVNYARYGSRTVKEQEFNLLDMLGFDSSRASALLVSSGMAAYSLVEAFLLRHVVTAGDVVIVPRYLYFEAEEQLRGLPHFDTMTVSTSNADDFLSAVDRHRPRVVFIDPMENTGELRLTDMRTILQGIEQCVVRETWVVIDGTMLSGAFDPYRWLDPGGPIKVLYYESGSKYMQMGLDLALVGLVVAPLSYSRTIDRLRRNTGTILPSDDARRLPIVARKQYCERMERFGVNVEQLCARFAVDPLLGDVAQPVFPSLPAHPDHSHAAQYDHLGGVMTFAFSDPAFSQRHVLDALIDNALGLARRGRVPLTKGVSFGFSFPRISAASAMAERVPPFLRLSIGVQEQEVTQRLADVLAGAIQSVVQSRLVTAGRR